ncbi:unnamed protein product [Sphagnum tenellum]
MNTTVAAGTFTIDTVGYIQGTALDAPNARYNLTGGVLALTETIPMWGGVGIFEDVPVLGSYSSPTLQPYVGRATTLNLTSSTGLAGFSVFDQNFAAINYPGCEVPLLASGMAVNYYRLGSGARIALACDPVLAASLQGGATGQAVSWNFAGQFLQQYDASTATTSITSITWANTSGGQATVTFTSTPPYTLAVGDIVNISGATNTGTSGNGAVNGNFTVASVTSTTVVVLTMPAATGAIGTIGGTIVANWGTGALNVKVLDTNIGNSMTVNYNNILNSASWVRNGTTAIVLI